MSESNDDFHRGYHGIPDDVKLRATSYVGLCSMLESRKPGTAAFMVIEAEKRRRDALPVPGAERANSKPDHAVQPSGKVQKDWHDGPLGKTFLTVSGAVIGLMAVYLLRNHLGLAF